MLLLSGLNRIWIYRQVCILLHCTTLSQSIRGCFRIIARRQTDIKMAESWASGRAFETCCYCSAFIIINSTIIVMFYSCCVYCLCCRNCIAWTWYAVRNTITWISSEADFEERKFLDNACVIICNCQWLRVYTSCMCVDARTHARTYNTHTHTNT